jgi:hypothetical protein
MLLGWARSGKWLGHFLSHFPTRIIQGSPDLFAFYTHFYTLSRIRIPTTLAHCTHEQTPSFLGLKNICRSPTLTTFVNVQILSTHPQTLRCQQLVDNTMVLSTVG